MKNIPGAVKRSGGPKTKRGKTASSKNAVRSGVYSRVALLEDETIEELEQLREAIFFDLQPQTMIQRILADDVVISIWRKLRLERYESKTLVIAESKSIAVHEWSDELGHDYDQILEKYRRYCLRQSEKGIDYYQDLLKKLMIVKELYPNACPDLENFKKEHSEIYQLSRDSTFWPNKLDAEIIENKIIHTGESFWVSNLQSLEKFLGDRISLFTSADTVQAAIPRIFEKRLYRHLSSEHLNKAADNVSRALNRSIAEFYREQDRYREREAIFISRDESQPIENHSPKSQRQSHDVDFDTSN